MDFNYEVSRSLAACQGVLLLVDANQGVQAQTVANFFLAFEADLAIIPVINKVCKRQKEYLNFSFSVGKSIYCIPCILNNIFGVEVFVVDKFQSVIMVDWSL